MKQLDKAIDQRLGKYCELHPNTEINWLSDMVVEPKRLAEISQLELSQPIRARLAACRNTFIVEDPSPDFAERPVEVGLLLYLMSSVKDGVIDWGEMNMGGEAIQLVESAIQTIRRYPCESFFFELGDSGDAASSPTIDSGEEGDGPDEAVQLFFEQCEDDGDLYATLSTEMHKLGVKSASYVRLLLDQPRLSAVQRCEHMGIGAADLLAIRSELTSMIGRVRAAMSSD